VKLARRQFLHLAAGAAALPAVSREARAQAYPARPVRIVVGFAAGGGADIAGIVADPAFPATPSTIANLQAAASTLGLQLIIVYATTDSDLETAFATFSQHHVGAVLVATVLSTTGAQKNLRPWRPAMPCPRSSHSVSSRWPAA
jgi:hypothetical protein